MRVDLTSRILKDWFRRHWPGGPPSSSGIYDPDSYSGQKRLNIVGVPLASKKDQPKLTRRWVKALPSLQDVRILRVSIKVSQAMFDAICEMRNLEDLSIKWSGVRSLEHLTKLGNLRRLHIGSSPQIESIEPLIHLKRLQWLDLENIKKIRNLSPLGECSQLLGLGIEGSMWTTQRIESLEPLSRLSELRYLRLANLRSADNSLKPLYGLRNLERLRAATWWPDAEIEELKRMNRRPKM